jgi:hypothetical protein
MNTDTISTGSIAVDYSKSLQDMMADGNYDWVNPAITPKGFPITAVGIVQFETKVFHFNRYISSEDAVEAITADDRRHFWEPAKIEGLLAYGMKNPNEQRQYPIVGLGSFAGVLGSRYVPYLYGHGAGRGLDLLWWDVVWYGHFRAIFPRRMRLRPSRPTTGDISGSRRRLKASLRTARFLALRELSSLLCVPKTLSGFIE